MSDYQIALNELIKGIKMLSRHCADDTIFEPYYLINKLQEAVTKAEILEDIFQGEFLCAK